MSALVVFAISLSAAVVVGVLRSLELSQAIATRAASPLPPSVAPKRAPQRVENELEHAA